MAQLRLGEARKEEGRKEGMTGKEGKKGDMKVWHNYDWGRQGRKEEGKEGDMKVWGNNDWGSGGDKERRRKGRKTT